MTDAARLHQLLAEASLMHTNDLQRIADVAAFLDGLAERLGGWPHGYTDNSPAKAAADCRAMAAKLRGEYD